jgi:hypothetical protein
MSNRINKNILFVFFFLFIIISCKKDYTCKCTLSQTVCASCYSNNEPVSSSYKTTFRYNYKAKSAGSALEACNNDHSISQYSVKSNGGVVTSEVCELE